MVQLNSDPIKLFQFIQKCHYVTGIYPPQSDQKYMSPNLINCLFLICISQIILTTVLFLIFDVKWMFEFGFTFFMTDSSTCAMIIYLIFIWKSERTFEYIENCKGFIEKRIHKASAYNGFSEKIEIFNKYFCAALFGTYVTIFTLVLPFSLVRYYMFNMGSGSFILYYQAWYPFDWKTPSGYFWAWLIQWLYPPSVGTIFMQFTNIFFGSCGLFIFMAEDITQDMNEFNVIVKYPSDEDRTELSKRFCDIVQIHMDAKQCVMEFNQMYKYSLFSYFAWNMLALASVLVAFQFQLWADNSKSFPTALSLIVLIWLIVFLFIICEPGQRVIIQFERFSDELSRCDWYLLPIELQRMYIIFLSNTENPIKICSYADIISERETAKKMLNKAFSYFMTFRKFEP